MTRRLAQADISRDDGLVDPIAKDRANLLDNLFSQIGSVVIHRHHDAADFQLGVQPLTDHFNRLHQLGDSLEGQVFGLDRNQDGVGSSQGVQGQQTQRRGTVDESEVVELSSRLQQLLQSVLPSVDAHQFNLGAHQIAVRRHQREVGEVRDLQLQLLEIDLFDQTVVEAGPFEVVLDPKGSGRIGLGVRVDQHRRSLCDRQRCRQVDGGRRLTDASLLVDDCDNSSHAHLKYAEIAMFLVESTRLGPAADHDAKIIILGQDWIEGFERRRELFHVEQ